MLTQGLRGENALSKLCPGSAVVIGLPGSGLDRNGPDLQGAILCQSPRLFQLRDPSNSSKKKKIKKGNFRGRGWPFVDGGVDCF
jgi:hypothetical protein